MTPQLTHLEVALPGLHASAPHALPFAPELHIRAFLLEREQGNVVVYASPEMEAGGVARRYLNHGHEAMFLPDGVDAPLYVHEADRAAVTGNAHVRATFARRHVLDGDFEAIPTPGHTPGATAYLWDSGEHRLLFTGDTIMLKDGEWVAAVLPSSDRAAFAESLELLRGVDFDVLVPWAASAGGPFLAHTDGPDARRRIDTLLAQVRGGG